jgi:pyrimidine deaminase RibD-like protein
VGAGRDDPAVPGAVIIFLALFVAALLSFPSLGTIDFIEYWSAYRIARSGGNPYDPHAMQLLQATIRPTSAALMMWNPPWLLLGMAPILALDFHTSAIVWLVCNVILLSAAIVLIAFSIIPATGRFTTTRNLFAGLLFTPAIYALALGQMGALLLFAAAIFFYGMTNKRTAVAALGLVLMTIKPHLFLLVFLTLAHEWVRGRTRRVALWAAVYASFIIALTQFVFPGSIFHWYQALFGNFGSNTALHAVNWIGVTIPGLIRMVSIFDEYGVSGLALAHCVIGIALIGYYYALLKNKVVVNWQTVFPVILAFSALFAPLGWFFDQTLLLPLKMQMLLRAGKKQLFYLVPLLSALELGAFIHIRYLAQYQHELFWYAPALLIVWVLDQRNHRTFQPCFFMQQALKVAEACRDVTFYGVGCVIVSPDGQILSTGFTGELKDPFAGGMKDRHAEEVAIDKANVAGISLNGATLFSTLEPCSVRKSGLQACTQRIIASGIAKVIYGAKEPYDPTLDIHCEGDKQLRQAGLQVTHLENFTQECLFSIKRKRA